MLLRNRPWDAGASLLGVGAHKEHPGPWLLLVANHPTVAARVSLLQFAFAIFSRAAQLTAPR